MLKSLRFGVGIAVVLAACGDGATGPGPDTGTTLEVDASQGWAYVNFANKGTVQVADPLTSSAWDIAFFATGVSLNGGSAGPGGVEGYCLCQNAGATDAAILAFTAESELADFDNATAAMAPTDDADWASDALEPVIHGWYLYNLQTNVISASPDSVILLKLRGTAYAKMHVIDIQGATQQNAGQVKIEFAIQPSAGAALGAPDTLVADVSAGRVYLDLAAGAIGTSASWDVALEGYTFTTNGGVSGDGGVGAVVTEGPFAAVPDPGLVPATVYRGDEFGGVFAAEPWYRYNLDGNNTISPTFNVYLIRRGTELFKLQVTGYYDVGGNPRHISLRFASLAP